MAKFTIYFKDKAIQSYIYDTGVVHIGRDDTNDLIIDNLTVAPAHAVVIVKPDACVIKQLNNDHPLVINHEKTKEAVLHNKDIISVGKHTIVYSTTESIAPAKTNNVANKDVNFLNDKLENKVQTPDANLQVLDGQHIGRILPLKKAMTRFGHDGSGVIIIAKRKDGYFISSLESNANVTVNQQPLADKTLPLNTNDIIIVDKVSMQFFIES